MANYKSTYRLRFQILRRDNFTCQYCGQYAPNVLLEVDHKISRSEGGTDNEDNLITACYACNRGKSGLRTRYNKQESHPAFRQNEILGVVKKSGVGLTTQEIMKKCSIKRSNADVIIKTMKSKGLLHRTADGKWICLASS